MNKLSVIIPAYNHAALIKEAINSVLQQTYENWELIIVDDGSMDNTKEIISKFNDPRIKYVYQNNSGVAAAMNNGFNLATGDFFGWLDADNYYHKDIFKKVNQIISREEKIEIIYGNVYIVNIDGQETKKHIVTKTLSYEKALKDMSGSIPVQPGVFFKNTLFYNVKGFNQKYKVAGDIDFWIKNLKNNPHYHYLDEIFGYYRLDKRGISQSTKGLIRGLKEMLEIGKEHKQNILQKGLLIKKYGKGLLSVYIKKMKNVK
jgi:glycosyltransferase involved in cell wall biosynthesis